MSGKRSSKKATGSGKKEVVPEQQPLPPGAQWDWDTEGKPFIRLAPEVHTNNPRRCPLRADDDILFIDLTNAAVRLAARS